MWKCCFSPLVLCVCLNPIPNRRLYLHLFPTVSGFPLPLPHCSSQSARRRRANSRRCSQELSETETTKPDVWRNIKHQEDCQHQPLIAPANRHRYRCQYRFKKIGEDVRLFMMLPCWMAGRLLWQSGILLW